MGLRQKKSSPLQAAFSLDQMLGRNGVMLLSVEIAEENDRGRKEERKLMKRQFRVWLKIAAVILLVLLFIKIIHMDEIKLQLTQPKGEPANAQDVEILMKEMLLAGVSPKNREMFKHVIENLEDESSQTEENEAAENGSYITYETYCILWQSLIGDEKTAAKEQKNSIKALYKQLSYDHKYKKDFYLLKEDWYTSYDKLLAYYGLQEVIKEEKVEILCGRESVAGKNTLEENSLLSSAGEQYTYLSKEFQAIQYTTVKAYRHEDRLLTLTEVMKQGYQLSNVWVMEADDAGMQFFYQGYELLAGWAKKPENPKENREQVADIVFSEGKAEKVSIKPQRINGKLLRIGENEIEVEGYGTIPLAKGYKGYRLYEELVEVGLQELSMGYDFADFVIEDGEVCAFLLVRKEDMERIRVLLRNGGFSSLYQERVQVMCEEEMLVSFGAYGERKEERIPAGEVFTLECDSKYLKGDRVELLPVTQTGKIKILSLSRSQGTPAYRGSLEITSDEKGLVVINEVLLEEYLYSVVPSEMPASYPSEALKAQAICARTYAYRYLKNPGLGNLGAHVDDSTGYQVYNNIEENVNSTKAVKETSGELLMYEGEPAITYYYSTSCGYGADERVWQEIPEIELPYLQPVKIAKQEALWQERTEAQSDMQTGNFSPEDLMEEENFTSYISDVEAAAYEKEEAWYRWSCEVETLDVTAFAERVKTRYQAVPDKILTMTDKAGADGQGEFVSTEPKSFSEIYDIRCIQRLPGGVMNELLIETDKGTYKIVSEYNIRYILNQNCEILRQDGSSYTGGLLLPSAYMVIRPSVSKEKVTGYELIGGGYGHGVGMSQNGAKAMAVAKMQADEILSFFFKGCQVEHVY